MPSTRTGAATSDRIGRAQDSANLLVTLEADISTTSATVVSATGLSFPADANAVYVIEAWIIYQTAITTTGFWVSASVPTSPTNFAADAVGGSGATTNQTRQFNAAGGGSAFGNALTGDNLIVAKFILRNGANPGTFQLQYATEVAGSSVTIKAGSVLIVRRIA